MRCDTVSRDHFSASHIIISITLPRSHCNHADRERSRQDNDGGVQSLCPRRNDRRCRREEAGGNGLRAGHEEEVLRLVCPRGGLLAHEFLVGCIHCNESVTPAFPSRRVSLTGVSVTGINSGGPVLLVYGTILLFVVSIGIASSLSELVSALPNAAGQSFWARELAPKKYSNIASYLAGWFAWAGSLFACASVALTVGYALVACYELTHPDLYVASDLFRLKHSGANSVPVSPKHGTSS